MRRLRSPRRAGVTAIVLTLSFTVGACEDNDEFPPPIADGSTGSPDAAANLDGATEQDAGSMDAAPSEDAGDVDSGDEDSGAASDGDSPMIDPDSGGSEDPCVMPGGGFDACACALGSSCAGGCGPGTVCLDNGCDETRCLPAGARCVDDSDCPAGSTCIASEHGNVCNRAVGCADSRDCPWGFACEGSTCVDRRTECSSLTCPLGYYCEVTLGLPFCRRIDRPCENDEACGFGFLCSDVDGDAEKECRLDPGCSATSMCSPPDRCGPQPSFTPAGGFQCGDYGLCTACEAGFDCLDLWGDGRAECVPDTSACDSSSDCPANQICAPPNAGGPAACGGSYGS